MASKLSPPPPLTLDELNDIIATHRQWVKFGGMEREPADLSGANLEGLDLNGYDLSDLDFRGANLVWVRLGDAPVEGANFREADLKGARHLLGSQLVRRRKS